MCFRRRQYLQCEVGVREGEQSSISECAEVDTVPKRQYLDLGSVEECKSALHHTKIIPPSLVFFNQRLLQVQRRPSKMSFNLVVPPAAKEVPYGAIGIAHYLSTQADPSSSPFEYTNVDVQTEFSDDVKAATMKSADGSEVADLHTILSVLGRAGNISGQSEEKGLVEAYQSDAAAMGKQSFPDLTQSLNKLDDILYLHAFLVGYAPSVADFAIWSAIKCASGDY